ncbi:uncharacterized protein LOC124356767 [Homalodisca vitripennis]|uniref:uncharacterized protein LOC124356767 n=1 Tax=Homalodisca vitripennis TaxID=197043 RepID=UPI001EEC3382|nr:uncharacterized protein LOC124356767 [Homalodisca vitripennis]
MCVLVTVMCLGLVVLEGLALPSTLHRSACSQQCVVNCERTMGDPDVAGNTFCCDCKSICDKLCRLQDGTGSNSVHSEPSSPANSSLSPESAVVSGLSGNKMKHLLASCRTCRPRTRRKPRSPSLREAALIARSVGLDLGAPGDKMSSVDDRIVSNEMIADWFPQLTSMSRDLDVVSARVAWEPLLGSGPWYLVTWGPEDGGLSGNLLTNTSTISLSLGSDTLYHVQISVTSTGQTSQCLLVDTHSALAPRLMSPLSGAEGVAGAGAAILVFLLAILLLAGRNRSPAKDNDQPRDANRFKLYPPPVTIARLTPVATPAAAPHHHLGHTGSGCLAISYQI